MRGILCYRLRLSRPQGAGRAGKTSPALIGKQENDASEVRFQSCFLIVSAEDATFPDQQIGVIVCKFCPIRTLGASYALADQKEIRTGDGFVVELCLPTGSGESLQSAGKLLQRLQNRIL